MILIISQHCGEYSTDYVMDWLDHKNVDYAKVNGNDFVEHCSFTTHITTGETEIKCNEDTIKFSEVKVFWYRRWLSEGYHFSKYENLFNDAYSKLRISRQLNNELLTIRNYLWQSQKNKPWLSNIEKVKVNKLEVLQKAYEFGLDIPDTIITNSKKALIEFKKKHGSIITKAIGEATMLSKNNISYSAFTAVLTDHIIKEIPEQFYPSLVQEAVDKDYELRVFYLDGEFYSMAIFSQEDEQTSIDFRDYNLIKPNRRVPHKLPNDIKDKLILLMRSLDLNTGSIDLIKTKNRYVFLEINPVGQFGMTSSPCNYHLEEKVADYLIQQCN
jgi:ATP-GRASP peptide maturase of grasp-with-spasm system